MKTDRVAWIAVILAFSGCAPAAESPNPWANYRGGQTRAASADGSDADRTLDQLPVSSYDAPRFDPSLPPRKQVAPARRIFDNAVTDEVRALPRGLAPPPAPAAEDESLAFADSNPDVKPHWSGAVIYCQPGCVPCAKLIRDLRKVGWKCGVTDANHFKIVELLTLADFDSRSVPSTPQIVFFVDGIERPSRITGYGGTSAELVAIVNRHPHVKRAPRPSAAMRSGCACLGGSPCLCDGNCQCAPIVGAACRESPLWYEAAPLEWSVPAVRTFSTVTHSAPVYVGTPLYSHSGMTFGPATHSAQLNVFGFPLIGGSIGTTSNW